MKEHQTIIIRKTILSALLLLVTFFFSCREGSEDKAEWETENSAQEDGAKSKDSAYIVDVMAADYAFGMPTEVPSGWVTFRMKNMGQVEHNAVIHKYVDTLQYETLMNMFSEALEAEGMQKLYEMFALVDKDMGGPAILSPDHTGQTTVFLEPGVYTFTCWMVAEDGKYHIQKGMNRPFIVTNENSGAEKPKGTVGITLSNFAIDIEDSIGAGEQIFNVNFEASQNVHLAKLQEGQDFEDLQEWMEKVQTPSPYIFLGGAEQGPVGTHSTFRATLEPGKYALVTHYWAPLGMAEEFTIPETGKAPPIHNTPVNGEVKIESDMKGTVLPDQVPTGRTPIAITNSGDQEYKYLLAYLNPGNSTEDIKQFFKEAYPMGTPPYHYIWYDGLQPGEVKKINLDVQEKNYVLIGPFLPETPQFEQWREENFVHSIQGVRK